MLSQLRLAVRMLVKTPTTSVIGTAVGLVLALFSTRALSTLLYNVGAFDAATFVFVTLVLGTIGLFASYIPALRATRADPMIALSHNA